MNITVAGMWHLGCVIAAGMARVGHQVTGYDGDGKAVAELCKGKAPLFEPGLDEAIREGIDAGRLVAVSDPTSAMVGAELLWIAYDTPVADDDWADTAFVEEQIRGLLMHRDEPLLVLVSSQMPAGSIARLEKEHGSRGFRFACSPENLRLGQALDCFLKPDRVVVGVRSPADRVELESVFHSIAAPIEWMGVESAEMAKHAINAFLALSVAFANELAVLCESIGADGREVERALKTESRIGPRAYVRPGSAFAGGTLARDVMFLSALAGDKNISLSLIPAIRTSNEHHKAWLYRVVEEVLGDRVDVLVAVLGLTYKPGTDTLRRSASVEFCRWAVERGCIVRVHDPVVRVLPEDLARGVTLAGSLEEACRGSAVIVVGTAWPEYRELKGKDIAGWAPGAVIVDPNRFLINAWPPKLGLSYRAVGLATEGSSSI